MKKAINNFCFVVFVLVFSSCRHELKSDAYIRYLQDNSHGLRKTIRVGDWEYIVQYKPYDYITLMENKGDRKAFDIKKRMDNLRGTAWFNISFKLANGSVSPLRYNLSSREDYDQRFNYFLNDAIHSLQLIYDGRDTLRPVGYLFENNYNLAPVETMVVGFDLPEGEGSPRKEMQLAYTDIVFKNGIIKAKYSAEDLVNIPKLIY